MENSTIERAEHAGSVFGTAAPDGVGGLGGIEGAPISEIHVFWLAGMSCDGCSVSVTGATSPSVEDLLAGSIPGMPRAVLHHPVLSLAAGHDFIRPFRDAVDGKLGAPYVVVLEGSVPDDQAFETEGYFSGFGVGLDTPDTADRPRADDQPLRVTDWLRWLAPGAAACIAIGTCATWGGVPAAAGNVTGSMGLMDYLGKDYRSALGVPVVNIPGCAPVGDNFTEVVAAVLLFLQGVGPLPEFDELGRPAWQFGETVHRHCVRAGYYEEGVFAQEYGEKECLVHVGCWGPVVQCNITERGAINHMGGCMVAGGPCIGCTMPGFPDKFAPFYAPAPGSALSETGVKLYGALIRRLRHSTMERGNRTGIWDREDDVPSGWSAQRTRRPTLLGRAEKYFYQRLQYNHSVHEGNRYRDQPLPRSRDVLQEPPD
jgi:hydrogenase small subunit